MFFLHKVIEIDHHGESSGHPVLIAAFNKKSDADKVVSALNWNTTRVTLSYKVDSCLYVDTLAQYLCYCGSIKDKHMFAIGENIHADIFRIAATINFLTNFNNVQEAADIILQNKLGLEAHFLENIEAIISNYFRSKGLITWRDTAKCCNTELKFPTPDSAIDFDQIVWQVEGGLGSLATGSENHSTLERIFDSRDFFRPSGFVEQFTVSKSIFDAYSNLKDEYQKRVAHLLSEDQKKKVIVNETVKSLSQRRASLILNKKV